MSEDEENEFEGVELAESIRKTEQCKHNLQTRIKEEITCDARKRKVKITICKKGCGYYTKETLEEEELSDNAIWR